MILIVAAAIKTLGPCSVTRFISKNLIPRKQDRGESTGENRRSHCGSGAKVVVCRMLGGGECATLIEVGVMPVLIQFIARHQWCECGRSC